MERKCPGRTSKDARLSQLLRQVGAHLRLIPRLGKPPKRNRVQNGRTTTRTTTATIKTVGASLIILKYFPLALQRSSLNSVR